jgi:MFS family permease
MLLTAVYGVLGALGFARGILTPAAMSIVPFLIPRELLANASAWRSVGWQGGAIAGPALAGFVYAGFGFTGGLIAVLALVAISLMLIWGIRVPTPPSTAAAPQRTPLLQSLHEGVDFVFHSKILLYSISLDLFSVLFGGVVAILPVFADDILGVGAKGLGVLRSAPAAGAMLTLLACTHYPPTRHAWRNLLVAVTGFGIATLIFGVSKIFWLSVFALALTGAFDAISVVVRTTVLQIMPPDHLRGRVAAVNSVFISASNELGAFESGLAARLLGTVPSVLFGGAMTLATVAYLAKRSRALLQVKLL